MKDVVAIAAGDFYSLALKSDGTIVSWGNTPNVSTGLSDVVTIATGMGHSLALKTDGTIVAWGDNHYGKRMFQSG